MTTSNPIEKAKARLTTNRIGLSVARETDKDLIALRDLIEYAAKAHHTYEGSKTDAG